MTTPWCFPDFRSASIISLMKFTGNTGAGFDDWKSEFAQEAKANGVNAKAIAALMNTSYATATIKADRNQKSFKYTLAKFWAVRGADTRRTGRTDNVDQLEIRIGAPPATTYARRDGHASK